MIVNVFFVFSLFWVLLYSLGVVLFLSDTGKNDCEMTYMYEYPQFVRIRNEFDKEFRKYGLYAYGEGKATLKVREMYFDGIPVLFVPGNGGSHRQARSLASIALRKEYKTRSSYHFDFFSVNLNKELSGLSGVFLEDQLDYVNRSIYSILKLYEKRKNPPKSVILIGHSMGGVIIRKIAQENANLIPIIISLSAPQKRVPILLDQYANDFYSKLDTSVSSNVTFVSLSGGFADWLVPTTLTDLRDENSIYVVTTHIPLSWIPSEHVSIVWCKQTILAVLRALFDCVDAKTKQITTNPMARKLKFKHHLIKNSGTKTQLRARYNDTAFLDNRGDWIERLSRQYSIRLLKGTKQTQWHMIRLNTNFQHQMLTIVAINLEVTDWVFACAAYLPKGMYRVCKEAVHLSQYSNIAPTAKYKRRSLTINMHQWIMMDSDLTHVVVRIPPTSEPVILHFDVYNDPQRSMLVEIDDNWWTYFEATLITESVPEAITYHVYFHKLTHVMQNYKLFVEPVKCSRTSHHATATLRVPWGNENSHKFFTENEKDPFLIRLYNSKPKDETRSAVVQLTLDPTCRYRVKMRTSVTGILGQFVRFYSPLLIANIGAVLILRLRYQLQQIESYDDVSGLSLFLAATKTGARPSYILGIVQILHVFKKQIDPNSKVFPMDDLQILENDGTYFFVLPLFLYLISIGAIWFVSASLIVCVTVYETTIHKLVTKFLARNVSFTFNWTDQILSNVKSLPVVASAVLIFLSYSACGALALLLGAGFYFIKIADMSQEYVERTVYSFIQRQLSRIKSKFYRNGKSKTTNEIAEIEKQIRLLKKKIRLDNAQNYDSFEEENNDIDKENAEGENNEIILSNDKSSTESSDNDSSDEDNEKFCRDVEEKEDRESSEKDLIANLGAAAIQDLDLVDEEMLDDNGVDEENEENKEATTDVEIPSLNVIFFHTSIFLIWVLLALINIPSALSWAHNFQYLSYLPRDPSRTAGLVASVCSVYLWQFDMTPKPNYQKHKNVGGLLTFLCVLSLMYAPISVYRLNYILSTAIVLVVISRMVSLLAEKREQRQEAEKREQRQEAEKREQRQEAENEVLEHYETVKAKIE